MPLDTITAPPETETKTTTTIEYVVISDEELEKPYRVIIENDDVTPMDFVVEVLLGIFGLSMVRATHVMLEAHFSGHAVVTVLPLREAQERVYAAHSAARANEYPLSFYLEPDE